MSRERQSNTSACSKLLGALSLLANDGSSETLRMMSEYLSTAALKGRPEPEHQIYVDEFIGYSLAELAQTVVSNLPPGPGRDMCDAGVQSLREDMLYVPSSPCGPPSDSPFREVWSVDTPPLSPLMLGKQPVQGVRLLPVSMEGQHFNNLCGNTRVGLLFERHVLGVQ
jgi:hypothetical protein